MQQDSRLSILPVAWWDERLSTKAAHLALSQVGGGKHKHKHVTQRVDAMAASMILQGALTSLRPNLYHNPDTGYAI